MSTVREPKQARSRALVARILSAAAELFAADGYERTTTNRVAAQAGVSVGSLYQFFADKHALLEALQSEWTARLGAALDETLEAGRPMLDVIDSVLEVHARLDAEQPGLLAVLLTAPTGTRQTTSVRQEIQQRLEQIIETDAPSVDADRRRVAAAMLIHLSLGLYALPRSASRSPSLVRAEVRQALAAYVATIR